MRTEVGVRQKCKDAGRDLVSSSRILWAYSLVAVLSAVVMGGSIEASRANPVRLASYNPAENFVVLSLKNSSTIAARVPQETLSSRYDVVSKPVDAAVPVPAIERAPVGGEFIEAFASQAGCQAGGMVDACPGFMTLLESKQRDWAHMAKAALPAAAESKVVLASVSEKARVSVDVITASIDRLETIAPAPSFERRPVSDEVVEALASQAACETGGMFDECAGFLALLHSRQQPWPRFAKAVSPAAEPLLTMASISKAIASEELSLVTRDVTAPVDLPAMKTGEVIIGTASTYNPYDKDDKDAGNGETASGELYNPIAWSAAIQIKLRGKFAGVRYGRLYQPSFALVELNGKRAIVKINDVGPLRPGRVIDLSRQVMHYFDPTLRRGVLDGMLVTPLVGSNWTPGPLGTKPVIAVAGSFL